MSYAAAASRSSHSPISLLRPYGLAGSVGLSSVTRPVGAGP
jgi:hypothetical protein